MQYVKPVVLFIIIIFCISQSALCENWPQWRGPQQDGSSAETGLPETWDANDALWVTPLPGPGAATPIIQDDNVFITAADKKAKQVLAIAIDAKTGKTKWQATLGRDRNAAGGNDMASPTPVTDGKHVWFLTGNGQLAAFTIDGKPVWQRDITQDYGQFEVHFGYSSSPLLYDGKLYIVALQNDKPNKYGMNTDRKEALESYLLALDPATGKTLWKHVRDTDAREQSREAYVTPYPYEWQGRREIILAGGECVTGHDPATGAELWRWWFTPADRETLQHNVPTPVATDGLIFVIRAEHRPLFAIRAGGKGTVGEDSVAWTFQENRCWIATPLVYQNRLYVLQELEHAMVCLEPKTGKFLWQNELPAKGNFHASPTAADGKIYCITLDGTVVVLAAGDQYRPLSTINLNDTLCRSSIAPANGKLYIRTGSKLYCFAKK
jgi:outer membrane protein assembly factor BamB